MRPYVTALVVFLVLGVVAGLVVPAVLKVRESAARLQTNNNLKQCALAVHTYHDNFNKLPDAFGFRKHPDESEVSMWTQLLPFVEARMILEPDKGDSSFAPYLAPSDPSTSAEAGLINFAANLRVFANKTLTDNGEPVNEPDKALVVPAGTLLAGLTLARIADGTTNTIMLSTRYRNCAGQRTWYAADAHGNCLLMNLPGPGVGAFMGAGSMTTPASRLGPITATFQEAPAIAECIPDAGIFGHSFGTRGITVALFDAAVRTVSATYDPVIFGRAICPADGESLGECWN